MVTYVTQRPERFSTKTITLTGEEVNTVDYPVTTDQLRASIESIFHDLGLQFGEMVKSNAHNALAQKQRAYFGESFVDQMEKNVTYMDVLTMQMEETAASYLCTGQPLLPSQEEIVGYIKSTCVLPAMKISPLGSVKV